MMQGDAFVQTIEIRAKGAPVTPEDVQDVEITFGRLSKTYSDKELGFSYGRWEFPFTQEETFRFRDTFQRVQVRVCWPNGDVEGVDLGDVCITESMSRRRLGGI